MNILFLATNFPYPPNSGHNLRTYNILKILSKSNNIHFLGFSKNKEYPTTDNPINAFCKSVELFKATDDFSKSKMIFSLLLNFFSHYPYALEKYYLQEMKNKINEIIINNDIDLVHFDLLHLSMYIDIVGKVPKTLTEHNVESERILKLVRNSTNLLFKMYMYIQYKKLYEFEKNICQKFDVCITVSDEDADTLKKMCPAGRYYVIPNGVDTEYFRPGNNNPVPNSLVWVGGMHDFYNREAINYFCKEVFPLIKCKVSKITFNAIGTSPTRRLINLSKHNKNVSAVGYVEDIRPYVSSSSIFIAPMLSGGGTKLKVLNAMSMGKPVVTTNVGAEGIDLQNGENIVIADNPEDYANGIIDLLKSPTLASKIGQNGRKLILRKYDWNVIGKKQLELYNSIVER